jgi:hypothetical protein
LITVGDFRQVSSKNIVVAHYKYFQVAPVVRFGGRTAICKASLRTQPVFNHFEILELQTSVRQRGDPAFSSFWIPSGIII